MKSSWKILTAMIVGGWSAVASAGDVPTPIPCDDAKIEVVVRKAGVEKIRERISARESKWSLEAREGVYSDPGTIRTNARGKTHVEHIERPTGTFVSGASLCHDDIVIVKATVEHVGVLSSREERIGDTTVSFPQVQRFLFDTSVVWRPNRPEQGAPANRDDLEITMRLVPR